MSRADSSQYRIGPRAVDGGDPLRVILVGRTGLDSALRVDRAIELLRAASPLEAIGELADPIDETSPRAATIVLAPNLIDPARAEAYAEALRTLEPDARVLSIGPTTLEGLDGHIPNNSSPEFVRSAVRFQDFDHARDDRSESRGFPDPPPATPAPVSFAPSPRPSAQSPAPSFPSSFDRTLLSAILAGKNPAETALADIARRFNTTAPPQFIAAPGVPTEQDAPASAPITHAGRTLGYLIAHGLDARSLTREAEALAPWLLLAAQQDQLKRAAFTDELTGAWNRRYFTRFLTAAIEHARVARHTVSLLCFDVDDFKKYNDAYGHAAGDEILTETVRLLNSVIRPSDRVCRIGGDEFVVIFHDPEGPRNPSAPAAAPQSIAQIAARFQKQICEHRFPKLLDQAPGTLTISGGIATFPWDGTTPQELLDRADALALQSKRQGKNVFTFGPGAERVCGIGEMGSRDQGTKGSS